MASAKKIFRRLSAARDEQTLVRVVRSPKHSDRVQGFVVAIGSEWVMLAQTMDGGFFDGHVAIRLRDIKSLSADVSFESRMSRTLPEWPPVAPSRHIDLDSTANLLRDVGRDAALIAIEKENERRAMWIGRVEELSKKWLWLSEIRPDATWHEAPLGYKLTAITAVSVGTHYLVGLKTVASFEPSK